MNTSSKAIIGIVIAQCLALALSFFSGKKQASCPGCGGGSCGDCVSPAAEAVSLTIKAAPQNPFAAGNTGTATKS